MTTTEVRPMTVKEKEQARRDYLADATVSVERLAAEYGVTYAAMQRALAPVARRRGGRERATITTEQMRRLADAGLSLSQIAKQAGITKSQVSKRLSGRTH
jgi:hypothetical protein